MFVRKCQTILKVILVDQFPYYSSDISHLLNPRFLTKIAAWLLFCIFDGMAVKTNKIDMLFSKSSRFALHVFKKHCSVLALQA